MKKIKLTQGKFALVDDEDFLWLSKWKWRYKSGKQVAIRTNLPASNGRSKTEISMHRALKNSPKTVYISHRNGDYLDNRKSNLRVCLRTETSMGQRKKSTVMTSRFKGVCFKKDRTNWHAQIMKNGKNYYLGVFDSEEDAALAYNEAAQKMFGEFARLNEL